MLLSLASAALFIASMVQVADHFQWLEWLNVETLRIARAVLPFNNSITSLGDNNKENRPVKIVVITNEMFERDFDQASPLDRTKLTLLFEDLLEPKNSPAVLAVDLDLSPSPSNPRTEQQFTDDLITAVKKSTTQLILITPMPVMLQKSITIKLDWMRKMCENGVRFALPDIVGIQNTIMNMPVGVPILGYEAYRVAKGLGNDYLQHQFKDPVNLIDRHPAPRICDCTDQELKGLLQILSTHEPVREPKGYLRINFDFPGSVDLTRLSSIESLDAASENLSSLKDRVVFLGGDYGSGDKYQTPVGSLSGLYLHVAAYYSNAFRVSVFSKPVALIIDFITAILFFLLFSCIRDIVENTRTMALKLVEVFLPATLSFLVILFAAFAVGWWNVWLHPATIITGMGTYIAIVHPPEDHEIKKDGKTSFMDYLLKYIIFYPTVFAGLYIVFI